MPIGMHNSPPRRFQSGGAHPRRAIYKESQGWIDWTFDSLYKPLGKGTDRPRTPAEKGARLAASAALFVFTAGTLHAGVGIAKAGQTLHRSLKGRVKPTLKATVLGVTVLAFFPLIFPILAIKHAKSYRSSPQKNFERASRIINSDFKDLKWLTKLKNLSASQREQLAYKAFTKKPDITLRDLDYFQLRDSERINFIKRLPPNLVIQRLSPLYVPHSIKLEIAKRASPDVVLDNIGFFSTWEYYDLAKQLPTHLLIKNIKKFDIGNTHSLMNIIGLIPPELFMKNFDVFDKLELPKFALQNHIENIMRKYPRVVLANLSTIQCIPDNFGFNLAQRLLSTTPRFASLCEESSRKELIKFLLKNDPKCLFNCFSFFNISDEIQRRELFNELTEKPSSVEKFEAIKHFKVFNLPANDLLSALLKDKTVTFSELCRLISLPDFDSQVFLISHISSFNLTPTQNCELAAHFIGTDFRLASFFEGNYREAIISFLMKNAPLVLIKSFAYFKILDESQRRNIFNTLRNASLAEVTQSFKSFELPDEDLLKAYLSTDNTKELINAARFVNADQAKLLLSNLSSFNFDRKQKIKFIYSVLNGINGEVGEKAYLILSFEKDVLQELSQFLLKKDPNFLIEHFEKFNISDENDRRVIFNSLAEKNLWKTITNFDKFQLPESDLLPLIQKTRTFPPNFLNAVYAVSSKLKILTAIAKTAPQYLVAKLDLRRVSESEFAQIALILSDFDPRFVVKNVRMPSSELTQKFTDDIIKHGSLTLFDYRLLLPNLNPKSRDALTNQEDRISIALLNRLHERNPSHFAQMIRNKDLDDDILAFLNEFSDPTGIRSVLDDEFKMNPSLPFTKEVLNLLRRYHGHPSYIQLRLMLQTHPDVTEIREAMSVFGLNFPIKKAFFSTTLPRHQYRLLTRALVLREREAIPIANGILKDAVSKSYLNDREKTLLELALKLYAKTTIAGSGRFFEHLQHLIEHSNIPISHKILALNALSATENEPTHPERKHFLIKLLNEKHNLQLYPAILDALQTYTFNSDEIQHVVGGIKNLDLSDPSIKQSAVYLAAQLPNEEALALAYQLVNSDAAEPISQAEHVGVHGGFSLFTYRPTFHDSKDVMNGIIRQRLVELMRDRLEPEAKMILADYKKQKDSHPDLLQLERNIKGFKHMTRYFPMLLFMPKDRVCFRGINARKGEKLAQASFTDFFVQGSGASDLSLFDRYDTGTWSKVGQMFCSTTLDYVTERFFDQDGLLMAIRSESLNEALLRRQIRLEREYSIHYVSYEKFAHHQISRIFLATHQKDRVEELASTPLRKVTKDTPKSPTLHKIAARNLTRSKPSHAPSLRDRVTYFKPEDSLSAQMKKIMAQENLREATTEEIIDENLIRRIIESRLLQAHLTNPILKKALASVPDVRPLRIISTVQT